MSLPLLMVLLAVAAPASPPPPSSPAASAEAARKQAKALVAEAQKLYAQKRYAEAAARFERAYAVRSVPAILFNLARCYDKLKDTPRALRAYRDYLRAAPGANDVAEVQAAILSLEKRLRSLGLSQLLVLTEPPKARVRVDGKELGETPASVELVTGKHEVSLRLEGHAPEDRMVEVSLEESPVLSVVMKPLPADAPRADAAGPALVPVSPPAGTQALDAIAASRVGDQPSPRTATRIAAGATGAVLLVGGLLLAVAHGSAALLVNDSSRNKATRELYYGTAQTAETLSYGFFIGAAVPAAATGVLFALGK